MSSVASAAAQHTGLPPNVVPCAPGFHFMIDSFAMIAPIGIPLPNPLRESRISGSILRISHAHIFPGAAHAALHLVANKQDA